MWLQLKNVHILYKSCRVIVLSTAFTRRYIYMLDVIYRRCHSKTQTLKNYNRSVFDHERHLTLYQRFHELLFYSPAPKTLQQIKKTDRDSNVNCWEDQKIIWAKGGGAWGGRCGPTVVLNSPEFFSHRQSRIIRNSEPCFLQSYGDFLCWETRVRRSLSLGFCVASVLGSAKLSSVWRSSAVFGVA
jgi:hypothetical protein